MDLTLPADSVAFADVFKKALVGVGGIELARQAESDSNAATGTVTELLHDLGIDDLKPADSVDSAITAVEICRCAGAQVLPHPLPELLTAQGLVDADALALVEPNAPYVHHADAVESWLAIDLEGSVRTITEMASPLGGVMSPFTSSIVLGDKMGSVAGAQALWMTLDAAYCVGALRTALNLTVSHVSSRVQFNRPLKDFQSVRFRVADMVVAVSGVEELTYYTAWALIARPENALTDALALRLATLDSARDVLQSAHQLHGAIGFTDEHDLSVLSRHIQARLRLPWDLEATAGLLTERVDSHGFDGLFTASCGGDAPC